MASTLKFDYDLIVLHYVVKPVKAATAGAALGGSFVVTAVVRRSLEAAVEGTAKGTESCRRYMGMLKFIERLISGVL